MSKRHHKWCRIFPNEQRTPNSSHVMPQQHGQYGFSIGEAGDWPLIGRMGASVTWLVAANIHLRQSHHCNQCDLIRICQHPPGVTSATWCNQHPQSIQHPHPISPFLHLLPQIASSAHSTRNSAVSFHHIARNTFSVYVSPGQIYEVTKTQVWPAARRRITAGFPSPIEPRPTIKYFFHITSQKCC